MGVMAMRYRQRKIYAAADVATEQEFYYPDESMDLRWPRPCWCEWTFLRARLLDEPEPESFACACSGWVNFSVPGYRGRWGEGDEHTMRQFAKTTA